MKKIYILFLVAIFHYPVFSQFQKTEKKLNTKPNMEKRAVDAPIKNQSIIQNNIEFKSNNEVLLDRHEIGISGNAYTLITTIQRCLSYDESSGIIVATHRADQATYPEAVSSGSIMSHYSMDNGQSWNHQITMNPDPDDHALRYPSGVIYNPENSSELADIYTVVAGPSHTGGVWDYTFFASASFENANYSDYYHPWNVPDGNDWARSSMVALSNVVYLFGQDYEDVGEQGVDQTMKQYVGTTDDPADGFEWEVNEVLPDWLIDPADGSAVALYTTYAAFSKDGSIGYMWMIGATDDSEDYGGYQPIVYFTENGGEDWDEIELNMEDHPVLVEYLPPWEDVNGNPGTVKPTMGIAENGDRNFPGVVDYQGKLHLFTNMYGSSTESVIDPDGGYWIAGGNKGGHLFDIILDQNGLNDIIFIDSIVTESAAENSFGDITWDHRLQASKSTDEKVVFAVWTDDIDSEDGTLMNPDIYAWAYNTETAISSEPINFTEDDLYAGFYLYHYVSELTPLIDGFYNIPISTSVTPAELAANDDLSPVTHTYVGGIGFEEDLFIGVDDSYEISDVGISMSQNSPNPFKHQTIIEFYSDEITEGVLEIYDIRGVLVYQQKIEKFKGTKEIIIKRNNLKSGIYFYSYNNDTQTVTKKMVID